MHIVPLMALYVIKVIYAYTYIHMYHISISIHIACYILANVIYLPITAKMVSGNKAV